VQALRGVQATPAAGAPGNSADTTVGGDDATDAARGLPQ
jgi:hypothetical protein